MSLYGFTTASLNPVVHADVTQSMMEHVQACFHEATFMYHRAEDVCICVSVCRSTKGQVCKKELQRCNKKNILSVCCLNV